MDNIINQICFGVIVGSVVSILIELHRVNSNLREISRKLNK